MGIPIRHVALFFTLILLWVLLARAHIKADKPKYYYSQPYYNKQNAQDGLSKSASSQLGFPPNKEFVNDEFQNNFEPFRTPPRRISPRAGFQHLDLYTARGYGKRSECNGRICRKKMEFSGARLYGKRNAVSDITPLICLLTDCNDLEGLKMLINNSEAIKAKDLKDGDEEINSVQEE